MKKEEFIARYGEAAYERMLEEKRVWYKNHPEEVEAYQREKCRKGGKYYEAKEEYQRIGLQGERQRIRGIHGHQYRPYKNIIAPDSQIHHEWIPKTSEYRGVALVEAKPHRYGIIEVIQILDGNITLLTEEGARRGETKHGNKRKKRNRAL